MLKVLHKSKDVPVERLGWKEVLDCKRRTLTVQAMHDLAFEAGYEFFLFRDIIYRVVSRDVYDVAEAKLYG